MGLLYGVMYQALYARAHMYIYWNEFTCLRVGVGAVLEEEGDARRVTPLSRQLCVYVW